MLIVVSLMLSMFINSSFSFVKKTYIFNYADGTNMIPMVTIFTDCWPMSRHWSLLISPENIRKSLVFWCFQGVSKEISDMKCVKENLISDLKDLLKWFKVSSLRPKSGKFQFMILCGRRDQKLLKLCRVLIQDHLTISKTEHGIQARKFFMAGEVLWN